MVAVVHGGCSYGCVRGRAIGTLCEGDDGLQERFLGSLGELRCLGLAVCAEDIFFRGGRKKEADR